MMSITVNCKVRAVNEAGHINKYLVKTDNGAPNL